MAEPLPAFVSRRRPEWEELARLVDAQKKGQLKLDHLQHLDRLYRRASADLARAQSFYPGTDAHRYLNQLVGTAYGTIYQPARERLQSVRDFFRRDFPRALREELSYVGLSAALLLLGGLLGAGVVLYEPRGAELLVPEHIREIVGQGKLWTDELLSVSPPGVVSAQILTNNLSVTIAAFALGATFGLGTVYVMVTNGIHIGAFLAYCFQHGKGWALVGFMGAHGFVELSIIVISGAAGLIVGHALIDPGELPRGQRVRQRAARAVRLVVGCAPFLALTGVVEGFISPGTMFPAPLKLALGLALGLVFWGYLIRAGVSRR